MLHQYLLTYCTFNACLLLHACSHAVHVFRLKLFSPSFSSLWFYPSSQRDPLHMRPFALHVPGDCAGGGDTERPRSPYRPALNDVDWFVSPVRFLIDRSHAITCKADMNQHVVFKNRGARARMLLALTSWSIFLVFATLACPPLPFCPVQEMKENLPPRAPTACSGVAEHLAHQALVPTPAPCNHHYFVRHPLACCGKQPIHGRWGNLSRVAK